MLLTMREKILFALLFCAACQIAYDHLFQRQVRVKAADNRVWMQQVESELLGSTLNQATIVGFSCTQSGAKPACFVLTKPD